MASAVWMDLRFVSVLAALFSTRNELAGSLNTPEARCRRAFCVSNTPPATATTSHRFPTASTRGRTCQQAREWRTGCAASGSAVHTLLKPPCRDGPNPPNEHRCSTGSHRRSVGTTGNQRVNFFSGEVFRAVPSLVVFSLRADPTRIPGRHVDESNPLNSQPDARRNENTGTAAETLPATVNPVLKDPVARDGGPHNYSPLHRSDFVAASRISKPSVSPMRARVMTFARPLEDHCRPLGDRFWKNAESVQQRRKPAQVVGRWRRVLESNRWRRRVTSPRVRSSPATLFGDEP